MKWIIQIHPGKHQIFQIGCTATNLKCYLGHSPNTQFTFRHQFTNFITFIRKTMKRIPSIWRKILTAKLSMKLIFHSVHMVWCNSIRNVFQAFFFFFDNKFNGIFCLHRMQFNSNRSITHNRDSPRLDATINAVSFLIIVEIIWN